MTPDARIFLRLGQRCRAEPVLHVARGRRRDAVRRRGRDQDELELLR